MTTRVQSLQCFDSKTCHASVDAHGCDGGIGRKRRSITDLEVIVTFTSTLAESKASDIEAFYGSKLGIYNKNVDNIFFKIS